MNIFIQNSKRTFVLFLFLTSLFQLKAQPGIIGDGFSTGWNNPTDILRLSPSFGRTYMIVLKPKTIGNNSFKLVNGFFEMSPTCTTNQDKEINNPSYAIHTVESSSCSSGGKWFITADRTTDNYVFKTSSLTGDSFSIFRIRGTIQTVSNVSHSPASIKVGQDVTVTATISGAFPTGQRAYIRYSSDNFITSTILQMNQGSNSTTYTINIPGVDNSLGTIKYYVFTSGTGISTSDGSKADHYSINRNDNNGSFYSYSVNGGNTYTWNVSGNGDWSTPSNWIPARNSSSPSDVLLFNNGQNNTITNIPTQTIGGFIISNNTAINLQSALNSSTNTLTIFDGISGNDLSVSQGSQLNINGAYPLQISLNTTTTGSISGSITVSNASHTIDAVSAGSIVFKNGSSLTQGTGFTGDIFTTTGTENIAIFTFSSEYIQKVGGSPFGFATITKSKVIFQTGSWYRFQANEIPSFSGRTFGNFEFNLSSPSKNGTGSNIFIDTLMVTNGTLNLNATGGVTIKGSIIIASGATLTFNPSTTGNFNLTNATPQSIVNSGTFTIGSKAVVNINSNATINGAMTVTGTLNMNNSVISGTGTTELRSGSIVSTNHSGGFWGSITTNSRSFQNDVNYTYTGSNNQAEGVLPNSATSITINKSAGNVTFPSNMTISSMLTFVNGNQGVINMGNNTLKILNTEPTAVQGNGYINGKLQRAIANGNNTYNFPIGTNDGNTSVLIAFTGISGTGNLEVQSYITPHSQTSTNGLSQTAYLKRRWQINNSGLSFTNANITFNYLTTDLVGDVTPSSLRLAQYNNAVWGYPSVSAGLNSITANNVTSFGDFIAANQSSVLPVELVSFDGYTEGGTNILKWITASQVNTSHFIIERSSNNLKNWFEITKPIPAAGTTDEIKKYSETDISPLKQAYYRLKIVDFDGKIQYSKVISIQKTGDKKTILMLYPNPVDEKLNIQFESSSNQKTAFDLLDIYGRTIQTHYFNAENGINNWRLNLHQLSKGVYFLKSNLEGKEVVEKIIKR